MTSHISNSWAYAISFLQMYYGEQLLSTGSGFFWNKNDRIYLISNWHNFSGRNPLDLKPLSPTGGIPNKIKFSAYKKITEADSGGFYELQWQQIEINLTNSGNLLWYQHPHFRNTVDVAAIDVTNYLAGFEHKTANSLEGDANISLYPSQDVFVVGYPLGLITGLPVPVWKRGTIATDPALNPEDLPKMYLDAATREGMSGSIVIARESLMGPYIKKDGTKSNTLWALRESVVGVYSGRIYPNLVQAQLGIVWKSHVIDEIIAGQKPPDNL